MPASNPEPVFDPARRRLLQRALLASGLFALGPAVWAGVTRGGPASGGPVSNIPDLAGTLHEIAVENDPGTRMMAPRGFSVREIARTGRRPVPGSTYAWHGAPDGGAVFPMADGGWVYVSNSEMPSVGSGGAGALRFNARGALIDSYAIARGTTNNCAGGPTPWGTWLSCEEITFGLVYECDPAGERAAVQRPALGAFTHEAVAVDPVHRHIYMTEDMPDGCFYRFVPDQYPPGGRADLGRGRLEAAVVKGRDPRQTRSVSWAAVPDPLPQARGYGANTGTPTRWQVKAAERFNGGEGCWYHDGTVYFSSKGDNRVWALDTEKQLLDLVYDKRRDGGLAPGINDVDNVTVSAGGDILVAEDGRDMRLVVVAPATAPFELLNIIGHRRSEITGPAFSPDGSRLYFSSQRGPAGNNRDGRTYEMRGPFFTRKT
jgi:secreted PhoX family phosphatase